MPTSVALILCAGLAVLALPMALRWIAPNRLYGFRTRATLSNRELWYSANAFAGWALLIAAIFGATLVSIRPSWFDFGPFTNLVAVVGPTIIATLATFFYIRNR